MPPADAPASAPPAVGAPAASNNPASPPSAARPPPSSPPPPPRPGHTPSNSSSGFLSAPSYPTPLRQHRRTPSQHREVKETLNAVSDVADDEDDGFYHHRINQYTIKSMIGRGSYGDVHLATDQYGKEYAVKAFSKARLRRRARTNIMKQGPFRAGRLAGPSARFDREAKAEAKDALYLIREEIAIMKKLNHPNLVELIEVLDDPEQDSLYMVMEMCKKGVIMDVGLGKTAKPYDAEACRYWFRDLILGIEYLHAQNIIHRDIKPDNLLVTDDDVLKIADFGVSEIFEKADSMRTNKIAGSPAFFPPELCVSNHGDVAGPPCDIWSMGVTLYCLRYGKIPFECESAFEIYDAISKGTVELPEGEDAAFVDLMGRILEKDPTQRITMADLRDHPWVTMNGTDPLLSAEENCANPVEPPNALELNHAFTRRMSHLLCVLRAISKFKGLLHSRNRASSSLAEPFFPGSASGTDSHMAPVSAPSGTVPETEEEVRRLVEERRSNIRKASTQASMVLDTVYGSPHDDGESGFIGGRQSGTGIGADNPTLLLGIGTGGGDEFEMDDQPAPEGVVSESPTSAEFDIYNRAFQTEIDRIRSQANHQTVYLTKVMERRDSATRAQARYLVDMVDGGGQGGLGEAHRAARSGQQKDAVAAASAAPKANSLADIVALSMRGSKS